MRQAVLQARQRLDCGDLSPLLSASASQAASHWTVPRAKAPASWRTPNAAARQFGVFAGGPKGVDLQMGAPTR